MTNSRHNAAGAGSPYLPALLAYMMMIIYIPELSLFLLWSAGLVQ